MARFLRRAARLLVTAGTLGAVPLALAGPPDVGDASGVRLVGAVHVTLGQAKMEAMKVEMALLADLTTYQLPVKVEIKGDTLEVQGVAPDEACRQQILQIARQACYLPVRDGLRVPGLGPIHPVPPAVLRQSVVSTLVKYLGRTAAGFDVQIQENGQVCLRGEVASMEDKLTASRCLRGLAGCSSIVNCLGIKAMKQGGCTFTLVTSDGQNAVAGCEPPPPASGIQRTAMTAETPPALPPIRTDATNPYALPPTPTLTLPSGLPPARTLNLTLVRPTPPSPTTPVIHIEAAPAPGPALPMGYTPPAAPALPTGYATLPAPSLPAGYTTPTVPSLPTGYSTQLSGYAMLSPGYATPSGGYAALAQTAQPLPGYTGCMSCAKGVQLAVVAPPSPPSFWDRLTGPHKPKPQPQVLYTTATGNAPVRLVEPPIGPAPAAPKADPPRAAAPAIAAVTTTPKTVWPPAHRVGPVEPAPAGAPFQPKPLVLLPKSSPPPATGPVVRVSPKPAPPSPTVQVKFQPPAPAAPAPRAPAPAAGHVVNLPPAALRKIVQHACGKLARDVRVESTPDHQMHVHVAGSQAAEQKLISTLLSVPEISGSNVKLEIHVSP